MGALSTNTQGGRLDATTQISIRGNWKKTNYLGIVPVTVSRATEIQAAMQARPSRAGEYKFEPPTYLAPDGVVKAMVWCPTCGDWKHREGFHKDRTRPNGLEWRCRKCSNTARAVRLQHQRENQRIVDVPRITVDKTTKAA